MLPLRHDVFLSRESLGRARMWCDRAEAKSRSGLVARYGGSDQMSSDEILILGR